MTCNKGTICFIRSHNILWRFHNNIPFQSTFPKIIHSQLSIFSPSMECSEQYWVPIFLRRLNSSSPSHFLNLITFCSPFDHYWIFIMANHCPNPCCDFTYSNSRYLSQHFNSVRGQHYFCLLYTSPSPRDATLSRMPSSA